MDGHNLASVREAQRVAFRILDQLQVETPGHLVAGAAMLFDLLVRRYRLDPREVLAQADRRIADALKDPTLRAIKDYLGNEL